MYLFTLFPSTYTSIYRNTTTAGIFYLKVSHKNTILYFIQEEQCRSLGYPRKRPIRPLQPQDMWTHETCATQAFTHSRHQHHNHSRHRHNITATTLAMIIPTHPARSTDSRLKTMQGIVSTSGDLWASHPPDSSTSSRK